MNTRMMMCVVLVMLPMIVLAQIIPIKTVPVATGDQFQIFPSSNLAMGGVSIALDDELFDPFENPAKGVRVQGLRVVSAPIFYNISLQRSRVSNNSALSLPVGALFQSPSFFGGLYWAQQKLSSKGSSTTTPAASPVTLSEASPTNNTYTFALAGTTVSNVALAASIFWGDLNAIEGIQLMYPTSRTVRQNGSMAQYKLGIVSEIDDHEFVEAVFLRSTYAMQYQVTPSGVWAWSSSTELHEDQTNFWGIQAKYTRPLAGTWRAGTEIIANWKDHPKIPNYQLMNIPRDPGNSAAYNFGVGISTASAGSRFGVDVIYEPIRTDTWADAAQPIVFNDHLIPAGAKTVENFFDFSNWIARTGVCARSERTEFLAGIQLHSINYHLHQKDNIRQRTRDSDESWTEWTMSLGLGFTIASVDIHYTGLMTTGTGQPSVQSSYWQWTGSGTVSDGGISVLDGVDFLPAPSGTLNLNEAWVFTHQVSFAVKIF